jgi:hypothetical protein
VALKPWIRLGEPLPVARSNTRIGITAPASSLLARRAWLRSVAQNHSFGSYPGLPSQKPVFCELCSCTFSSFTRKGFDTVIVSFLYVYTLLTAFTFRLLHRGASRAEGCWVMPSTHPETAGRAPMPGSPAAWEPPQLGFRIGPQHYLMSMHETAAHARGATGSS